MITPRLGRLALGSLGLLLGAASSALAQTPTYKSIPLDCGGWFSGFDISTGGRLYGYGDVFGVWRSDAGKAGSEWRYLQADFTSPDNIIVGLSTYPSNPDIVVFLTSNNVYKSTNGGWSWDKILTNVSSPGSLPRGSKAIFINPTNSNEIWLARGRAGMTGQLWRSTNGGSSWDKVGGSTFDSVRPLTIYIHPQFPSQIWVGAVGGFYVSVNGGSNWSLVWNYGGQPNPSFPNEPAIVRSIVRRNDGVGYFAANIGGFRVTTDSNWNTPGDYVATQTVNRVGGQGPVSAAVLANGDFLTTSNESYVKRSSDGISWNDLASTLVTPPTPAWTIPATSTTKAPGGRDMIIADPTDPSRWFMTGGKSPVITTDSGATWKYPPALNGLAGVPTHRVQFPRNNANRVLISASDQGVFTLDDGGASREADSSARASIDTHQTYHQVMSSDSGTTLIAAGVHQGNSENMIIRSNDAGVTWAPVAFSGLPTSVEGITRAVATPGNVNDFLVLLGANPGHSRSNPGLYRTINGGASFSKVGGTLFDGVNTGSRNHPEYSWLESDGVNTDTRYLTLRAEGNEAARGFYRSTNRGANWTKLPNQPFLSSVWIQGMCVDPTIAGRVWVVGDFAGIRRSDNGGDSWTPVTGFTNAMRISAHGGRLAVWGRRSGDAWNRVYYSLDDGATWSEKTGPNHRYAFLTDLTVDPYRVGQIWISGLSVNVIDTGTGSSTSTPPPSTPDTLENGGFESGASQTPSGWSTWASSTAAQAADYTESVRPRSGSFHLTHSFNNWYQVYTYKVITGLANGTYTVKAWSVSSGGQWNANMTVKNYGGSQLTTGIGASSNYVERTISGINVTNGQIEIGFWSDSNPGYWMSIDDVSLTRTSP